MKAKEVIELAKKNNVQFIDLKFIDFPGVWQHTQIPAHRLDEGLFEDGLAFDGTIVSGSLRVTSDVSAVLDLEVIAGFYDAGGAFIGTARFVHHAVDDGPTDPMTGTPVESIPFQATVPAEFAGRAVSASVGVPVLVNE